ncbi:hypothetical protein T07_12926 [Trichinella nelsoni]|uniref:Uncharacterized protein n=1 Tax=Trichinella nelsoni TaxID=6336 RepID=A0A0V0RT73_9BILA|nr:hypothetical protein T07_12926 [Trichinella nelsoni]
MSQIIQLTAKFEATNRSNEMIFIIIVHSAVYCNDFQVSDVTEMEEKEKENKQRKGCETDAEVIIIRE